MTEPNPIPFTKMHGLGNDFVVIDGRHDPVRLSDAQAQAIADRRTGIGCDQLIVIEPPRDPDADVFMVIRNRDGSIAEACGNAARCIAARVMGENKSRHAIIETVAGLLDAETGDGILYSIDMGPAHLDWRDIPLGQAMDTLHLKIQSGPLTDPVGVNMGNPHAVFFVDDADAIDLNTHGPLLEHHALFPGRANISVAQVMSENEIRLRVWERGVGETSACGSAACATMVAAYRRKLTGRSADVVLNGGTL
ncbi:MAG TPA: diaminopimelate epimerase, partial [Rhodospirillales bacterium]|nr:diaminopimelate epimerase [Rhodospirillales bacterium]